MWSLAQFVHMKSSTVSDTNVDIPITALVAPVKAHFTSHRPLGLGRMRSTQPSRCMSSTVIFSNTLGWHSWSCSARETVPLLDEPTLVTLGNFLGISTCTFCIFQDGVYLTFWKRYVSDHSKYLLCSLWSPTVRSSCGCTKVLHGYCSIVVLWIVFT